MLPFQKNMVCVDSELSFTIKYANACNFIATLIEYVHFG